MIWSRNSLGSSNVCCLIGKGHGIWGNPRDICLIVQKGVECILNQKLYSQCSTLNFNVCYYFYTIIYSIKTGHGQVITTFHNNYNNYPSESSNLYFPNQLFVNPLVIQMHSHLFFNFKNGGSMCSHSIHFLHSTSQ